MITKHINKKSAEATADFFLSVAVFLQCIILESTNGKGEMTHVQYGYADDQKMMKEQYALRGVSSREGASDPMKRREASDASMFTSDVLCGMPRARRQAVF